MDDRLAGFGVHLGDRKLPFLRLVLNRQAFLYNGDFLPAIGESEIKGFTVHHIALAGNFHPVILAQIQRFAGGLAVHRLDCVYQLASFVAHRAVAGDDVGAGVQFKGGREMKDRLAGFLVHLGNGKPPLLRGVRDGQGRRGNLHRLPGIFQRDVIGRFVRGIPLALLLRGDILA